MRLSRLLAVIALLPFTGRVEADEPKVDFNRDIRPILSDTCFVCHGPDAGARVSDLRFDRQEVATSKLESGVVAIVPGKPEASEMIARITAEDDSLRMPPSDFKRQLTPREIELFTTWVAQGAEYKRHWSFIAPVRPTPPAVSDMSWVENPIDQFILKRLDNAGLKPNSDAIDARQLRRLTLDLTGLPPTLDELDAFLAASAGRQPSESGREGALNSRGADALRSPDAYERAVDRLLASPRFGEHQARYWLDAARYGDTHGLHLDNMRSMFPYRKWVIDSFNANKPFDEFTVEQIAGDLLPNPTTEQIVATGFNRCNVTTSEGGAINEEFRVRYAVDRTEAVGTVFMGLTVGCAVCHDHKYDPITQKEFYRLFAYYNSTADPAMDGNSLLTPPVIKVPSDRQEDRMAKVNAAIAANDADWKEFVASLHYERVPTEVTASPLPEREEFVWVDDELPPNAKPEASGDEYAAGWRWVGAPDHPVLSGKVSTVRQSRGKRVAQHFFTGADPLTIGEGDVLFAYVYVDAAAPPKQIMLQFNDGTWEHRAYWGDEKGIPFGSNGTPSKLRLGDLPAAGQWVRLEVPAASVGLSPGTKINGIAFTQAGGTVHWDKAGVVTQNAARLALSKAIAVWEAAVAPVAEKLPEDVRAIVAIAEKDRTEDQRNELFAYFQQNVNEQLKTRLAEYEAKKNSLAGELSKIESAIPSTLVMADNEKMREAYVLVRGEYDKHGDVVEPGVPAALPPLPENAPPNRLALAKWLVNPQHPLTARVTVNRIWQHYFGVGLVKTAGDFGSQGEWPSHPDLLDWLAVELIDSGWDIKHIHRLIVTSHAYRQSSQATPDKVAKDPENRLISRGPRFRLDAEVVRDCALATAGLLVEKIGGPSVKPYQPPGLWEAVGYTSSNTAKFVQDHGEDLYRRGIYTFWKRTSPPPMLQTFDAPSREACTVSRARTNTPLQALALMNDVQFVEAARHFAARILNEGGADTTSRLTYAFRLVTARVPTSEELAILSETLDAHRAEFEAHPDDATKLLSEGESPRDSSLDPAEHAAWTMIANLLLNLDEAVTKG